MPDGVEVAALIPAAGSGLRLGLGPKAFVRLGSRTMLQHTAAALAAHVHELVVAVPGEVLSRAAEQVPRARFVAGGATRQQTVHLLLEATEAEIVLIHDVARPFLPAAIVSRIIAAVRTTGAATVARRPADSLIHAISQRTCDRSSLLLIQTPQGFQRDLLLQAHRAARRSGFEATDDAALVRWSGHAVTVVEGSPWLFKVTGPEDLELARALVESWCHDG